MYRHGHFGATLLVYAPMGFAAAALGFQTLALLGGGVALALAMLPDYDQRIPKVAHRGPTHTAWFALLVGVLLAFVGGVIGAGQGVLAALGLAVFGFLIGAGTIASHIAADALTPAGVRPFTPSSSKRYTYDIVKASNPIANYVLLGIGVLAALVAVGAGSAIASL